MELTHDKKLIALYISRRSIVLVQMVSIENSMLHSRLYTVGSMLHQEFAERTGAALTVIRKIEQGKTNLNMDKVNLVLKMFGHELAVVNSKELNEAES